MGNRNNTTYYHGDGSNKVYAKLENQLSVFDEMTKKTESINLGYFLWNMLDDFGGNKGKPLAMQYSNDDCERFYGCATCDDRDEFDLERGKKIASLKADMKYHDKRDRDYATLIATIDKIRGMLVASRSKHIDCYNRIYDKLISEYGWKDPCLY